MKLKTGDKVVVITGKDKGKEGKITKILKKYYIFIILLKKTNRRYKI